MRTLRQFFVRFGGLFNKQCKDRELDEEIESHLQLHIEDNVRLGMTSEEARRLYCLKRHAAFTANVGYVFNNAVRRGDHL